MSLYCNLVLLIQTVAMSIKIWNNSHFIEIFLCIIIPFSAVLFLSSCNYKPPLLQQIEIKDNWTASALDDTVSFPVKVPGCIHTDLMANGIIEDPFYRLNESKVQWVDKKDWVYTTKFDLPEELYTRENKALIFKGLDTYANVYLNDCLVLNANNMFRSWTCDVSGLIRNGENELSIIFESPIRKGLEILQNYPYDVPVSANDQSELGGIGDQRVSTFIRKAPYHFGWDWGPRLVTSGIWKPIFLQAWNSARITDLYVKQTSLATENAKLDVHTEIKSNKDFRSTIEIMINNEIVLSEKVNLKDGENVLHFPIEINNPKLWWPNELGEQILYNIEINLFENKIELDSKNTNIGLRTVEMMQETDSIGESFYFKVNGSPVFMKGANVIPLDVFLPRIQVEDYEKMIRSAKTAHMNMLRVWGGGIYESDLFYNLCDQNGILVWQDFMFACSMVPGDSAFLENVKLEAIDNIKRLRNHPSLALWCGNNEVLSAWENWGWKNEETEKQGEVIANILWNNYENIFHKILPEAVKRFDPGRYYHASSPGGKPGVKENPKSGDMHYWMVWWGKEPFEHYKKVIPRFMSEYGFQSFPDLNAVNKFAVPEDWDIYSEVMKAHQRSSIGNETIEEYLLRDYLPTTDFPMFLYVNQLLQAHGIEMAIESHRKNKPRCMGSLYWQMNDVWPVASWSGIDYYGNWKALQYTVEKAFRDVIIVPDLKDKNMNIYIVSDRLDSIQAELQMDLIDFNGTKLKQEKQSVVVPPNTSEMLFNKPVADFLQGADTLQTFLYCQLLNPDNSIVAEKIFYFTKPKNLLLEKPEVQINYKQLSENQIELTIKTDRLAKNLYCFTEINGLFIDNCFDILPNSSCTLTFNAIDNLDLNNFKKNLKIFTLWDSALYHNKNE